MQELQTNKNDFNQCRLNQADDINLENGEIKLTVDRFAFTANNITYAVMGEKLKYWDFYQPAGDDASNWGIIPVWGFADVIESKSDDITVGERLFGYFPPAESLKLKPVSVTSDTLLEGAASRAHLPVGYNLYRRVNNEPGYNRSQDDERMLLFVLHLTAFCIHDMLESAQWHGAEQVVIISASSKTSSGLAAGLSLDEKAPTVIGLTSNRNLDFVNATGIYDAAFTYDDLTQIDASKPTVVVDMSANTDVLSRLHTHLGDNMRFCSNVGLTHWEEPQHAAGINQARSQMFFAPGHIQQRIQDWGSDEFERRSTAYVMRTIGMSRKWLKITELDGLTALAERYPDICAGRIPADEGLVVQL